MLQALPVGHDEVRNRHLRTVNKTVVGLVALSPMLCTDQLLPPLKTVFLCKVLIPLMRA